MTTWQQGSDRPVTAGAMAIAILLPPHAVFIARGITPAFWATVAATAIGWLPGAVLALLLLLAPGRIAIR